MGRPRLQRSDPQLAAAEERDRLAAIQRIRALPERSPERKACLEAECARLGISPSRMYGMVKDYSEHGADAARRKQREDAGKSRDSALENAWVAYCRLPANVDRNTSVLAAEFVSFRPECQEQRPPVLATLQRWRSKIDTRYAMTPKEQHRATKVKVRVNAEYANQAWIADQRVVDIFVWAPDDFDLNGRIVSWKLMRPQLFHFVDVHSGLEMGGSYQYNYDTAAVEAALIDAIYPDEANGLPWGGVPEMIWWDHGKQHWSEWSREAARVLGIHLVGEKSAPAEPTHHGFIESIHHIIKDQFESGLPGYCAGESVRAERPLAMRLVDEGAAPPPEYLTLDQLNAAYKAWVREQSVKPYRRHGTATDLSRIDRWRQTITQERFQVPDRAELGWQFMHKAIRRVNGEGHIFMDKRGFTHPVLGNLKGWTVEIRYLRDVRDHVWVLGKRGELLCIAEPVHDCIVGDNVGAEVAVENAKAARRFTKELRSAAVVGQRLADQGVISEEQAEALRSGAEAVAEAVKPGRVVLHDVTELARQPEPELAEVAQLFPKPGELNLAKPAQPKSRVDDLFDAGADQPAAAAIGDSRDLF